jgi:hypothetical protein
MPQLSSGRYSSGFRRLCFGLAAALILPSVASAVPISNVREVLFYSFQLRGISFGPSGELVSVHVLDRTGDATAFGSLTITDLMTSSILYSFTSGDLGTFSLPGTYDSAPFLLPYGNLLQYSFSGRESFNMSIIFGDTVVASYGSSFFPPMLTTYTTTERIADPNPPSVPDTGTTLSLLSLSLVSLLSTSRLRAFSTA